MQRVRQKNTSAETALRRELHARGIRYRIHVPVMTKPRRVADGAFSWLRAPVFDERLRAEGWKVIRAWAHEESKSATGCIAHILERRRERMFRA